MRQKKKDKKDQRGVLQKWLPLLFGVCFAVYLLQYQGSLRANGVSAGERFAIEGLFICFFLVSAYLQTVIHEGGHLICGLLSGYRFSSFRIGSFILIKMNGKICFKRSAVLGMSGQCLMIPPDLVNGKMPFVLYNLGGVLANLCSAILFGILAMLNKDVILFSGLCGSFAAAGLFVALLNGIPMHTAMVDNDGQNILTLRKSSAAVQAFWVQLKMNAQMSDGVRLRDMPEAWFTMPAPEEMQNPMVAAIGVYACNWMMDTLNFAQAEQMIEQLLSNDAAIVGLHRNMLLVDYIFCELVGENRSEVIEPMWNQAIATFMKKMKHCPNMLRTQYAYALLAEHDQEKAGQFKLSFEKAAQNYPYKSGIEAEREYMEYAAKRMKDMQ